jgi:peptide methionine sulfoxide reductase MsrA
MASAPERYDLIVIGAGSAAREAATRAAFSAQPVLTEIVRAPQFYRAEERHQRYLEKRSHAAVG